MGCVKSYSNSTRPKQNNPIVTYTPIQPETVKNINYNPNNVIYTQAPPQYMPQPIVAGAENNY